MLLSSFYTVKNGKGWLEIYEAIDTTQPKCRVEGFEYKFNVVSRHINTLDEQGRLIQTSGHQ